MMTAERAAEILAAYGADPARWPVAERAQCVTWLARDAGLAAECARAARLDRALAVWAQVPVDLDIERAIARATAALPAAETGRSRLWRPLLGAALAASIAGALYLAPDAGPSPPAVSSHPTVALNQRQAENDLFRATFTPTPDEEAVL